MGGVHNHIEESRLPEKRCDSSYALPLQTEKAREKSDFH